MGGLGEGFNEPYSQQVGCIIKLALSLIPFRSWLHILVVISCFPDPRALFRVKRCKGVHTCWNTDKRNTILLSLID